MTLLFLNNSSYCNLAPLFIGPTVLFVSKEPKVKELLSTLRVSPQMTLLGEFCFQIGVCVIRPNQKVWKKIDNCHCSSMASWIWIFLNNISLFTNVVFQKYMSAAVMLSYFNEIFVFCLFFTDCCLKSFKLLSQLIQSHLVLKKKIQKFCLV